MTPEPRARILVVDDEETSVHILSAMLRADYVTSSSRTAEAALVMVAKEIPDVIISDVEMPGIGGLELTRRLKAAPETQHVPVLLITARADHAAVGECLDAGADDYLAKPVRRHELLARTRSAVRASRLQRAVQDTLTELHAANAQLSENLDKIQRLGSELGMAQKLESIAQLASGLAHEINTPAQFIGDNLSFLHGSVAQLLGQLRLYRSFFAAQGTQGNADKAWVSLRQAEQAIDLDFLAAELPQSIAQSQTGIDRIVEVVRVMERYSVGSGDGSAPVDIHAVLEAALSSVEETLTSVETIERNFDFELPMVPCLAEELQQAFAHLLANAAWAIGKLNGPGIRSGKITIESKRVEQFAEIRVSDTGCGIPSEVHSRIFDPYFTTKPEGTGSGQGLALAHAVIVARHHGAIRFTTELGKGSTFFVLLPLCPDPATSAPRSMGNVPSSRQMIG
jgi:two-component system, NtrC family, sensor kinase